MSEQFDKSGEDQAMPVLSAYRDTERDAKMKEVIWGWWLGQLEHQYGCIVRDAVDNHEYHDTFFDAIELSRHSFAPSSTALATIEGLKVVAYKYRRDSASGPAYTSIYDPRPLANVDISPVVEFDELVKLSDVKALLAPSATTFALPPSQRAIAAADAILRSGTYADEGWARIVANEIKRLSSQFDIQGSHG